MHSPIELPDGPESADIATATWQNRQVVSVQGKKEAFCREFRLRKWRLIDQMMSTSLSVCSKGWEGNARKQGKALFKKFKNEKSSGKDYKQDSQISTTVIDFKDYEFGISYQMDNFTSEVSTHTDHLPF